MGQVSKATKAVELENAKLEAINAGLKAEGFAKSAEFQNSMSTLVLAAQAQSNLTSFNPIITNNIYAPITLNWTMLMYMFKTHGVIQTSMEVPVLDALRGGLEFKSKNMDHDDLWELEDEIEKLGVYNVVAEGQTWARLFGGAALIINAPGDPATELTDADLLKADKVEFYACNRWELGASHKLDAAHMPGLTRSDGSMAAPRTSETYLFYGKPLHQSRVLTLMGKNAPYILRWQLAGWGMSEVERMVEPFNQYLRTMNVIYELLNEAKIDVYMLQNFNTQLGSAAGTALTEKRINLMNQLKKFNSAVVMDMNDKFDQKQLTFSGLAEMMKEARIGIAAALRMPLTKLFGLSATGFSSGEDDIENYNAMVESEVRQPLRPTLRRLLEIIMLVKHKRKLDLTFEYRPLRMMSAKDEEEIKTQKHKRIMDLYDRALIDSQEVGQMEQKDKLVSIDIDAAKGLLDPQPVPDNLVTFTGRPIPPEWAEGEGGGVSERDKAKADKSKKGE